MKSETPYVFEMLCCCENMRVPETVAAVGKPVAWTAHTSSSQQPSQSQLFQWIFDDEQPTASSKDAQILGIPLLGDCARSKHDG